MGYVGMKVYHKAKYGTGIIISEQGNTICVKFNSCTEGKKFTSPDCFKNFLSLVDENAARIAKEELLKKEESDKAIASILNTAKKAGKKVVIRAENKSSLPSALKGLAIETNIVTNPITTIDKKTIWYGMPFVNADFLSEQRTIPTKYRPIIQLHSPRFARALESFLDMKQILDKPKPTTGKNDNGTYDTFSAYVSGEIKCSKCKAPMQLKKKNNFFLACTNYPNCKNTSLVDKKYVHNYLYFKSKKPKACPIDGLSLEEKVGKYGLYVSCCALYNKHYYKLDEI